MSNSLQEKTAKKQSDDLISVLVSQGSISSEKGEDVRNKAKEANQTYFEYILDNGIVDEDLILKAASVFFGLNRIRVHDKSISDDLLTLIPEEIARKHKIVPFEKDGNIIKLALNDPYKLPTIDKQILKNSDLSKYKFRFYLTKINDIKSALSQYNSAKKDHEPKSIEVQEGKEKENIKDDFGLKNDILKILVKQNVVDQSTALKYQSEAEESNKSVEDILIKKGIDQALIQKAKAQNEGLKFVRLNSDEIDKDILNRIPLDIAQKYNLVAYDEIGGRILKVATFNPKSKSLEEIINFAQAKKGISIELSLTTKEDLDKALSLYKEKSIKKDKKADNSNKKETEKAKGSEEESSISDSKDDLNKPSISESSVGGDKNNEDKDKDDSDSSDDHEELKGRISSLVKQRVKSVDELNSIIEKGSVPRIVAGVVNFALRKRASDVHIQPTDEDSLLRYRIDGVLNNVTKIPGDIHSAIVSRIKILSKLRIDEKRIPQDGRFEVIFDKREIDLRVSTMPTTDNEKVVLRLLDKSKKEFNLEDLGMKGSSFSKLTKNIEKPYGMIVATGPTGSGKSTTLYAAMSKINNPKINIVTLEDPIEYELKGVSQSQARPDIGYSFANGLRSVLRQDPDVIMVGEIRDKETAEMSIHAALTGHLLFTTLHTNDAAGAIPRLIDMGIEPFLISSASNAFLAQRLVRKICPHCKQKDPKFDDVAKKKIKNILSSLPKSEQKAIDQEKDWNLYKGKGCDKCYQGYKGRVGIFEVLEISQNIRAMIHKDSSISEIRNAAIKDGMVTMEQDGVIKALRGLTTLEEVFRVVGVVEEQF